MQNKQNTNYTSGTGCIFSRTHPKYNYGQTGSFFTDASTPKGCVWFFAHLDTGYETPAAAVKCKDIFTKESTYVEGVESYE